SPQAASSKIGPPVVVLSSPVVVLSSSPAVAVSSSPVVSADAAVAVTPPVAAPLLSSGGGVGAHAASASPSEAPRNRPGLIPPRGLDRPRHDSGAPHLGGPGVYSAAPWLPLPLPAS